MPIERHSDDAILMHELTSLWLELGSMAGNRRGRFQANGFERKAMETLKARLTHAMELLVRGES